MRSLAGITAASRYRQRWGKILAFATLLTLVASILGMRIFSSSMLARDIGPAAHVELTTRGGDAAQDDTPLASFCDVDNDDDDDDDSRVDTIVPRSSLSRPLLGASMRATAWLVTGYQSFISGPSTPPPRA